LGAGFPQAPAESFWVFVATVFLSPFFCFWKHLGALGSLPLHYPRLICIACLAARGYGDHYRPHGQADWSAYSSACKLVNMQCVNLKVCSPALGWFVMGVAASICTGTHEDFFPLHQEHPRWRTGRRQPQSRLCQEFRPSICQMRGVEARQQIQMMCHSGLTVSSRVNSTVKRGSLRDVCVTRMV
jgi:hypothetical protein